LEHCKRDLALFNLAIDSKLRGCDLIRLQVNEIYLGGKVRDRTTVIQRKTGRPVQFEITEQTRASIRGWHSRSVPQTDFSIRSYQNIELFSASGIMTQLIPVECDTETGPGGQVDLEIGEAQRLFD